MEIGFEILKILLMFMITIELALILYGKKEGAKEDERTSRREVYGTFKDPLGDSYRRNTRNQYIPVHPGGKMLDGMGDDEE